MKRIATLCALLLGISAAAQTNFQTLYDFGRGHFTTTLEGFHQDKGGNTFFFVDLDYASKTSPTGAYMEIARCLNFWQESALAPLSLQVEYNGGLGLGFGINHAFLAGVDYFVHSQDFRNTFNFKVLYKYTIAVPVKVPMQFTFVWGLNDLFGLRGVRFSGFVDVWDGGGYVTILSEPQLWYNFGEHFALGGEVELSKGFVSPDFKALPCVGFKWTF